MEGDDFIGFNDIDNDDEEDISEDLDNHFDDEICPWITPTRTRHSDVDNIPLVRLHNEILSFCKFVYPSKYMMTQRINLINTLNEISSKLWPNCSLHVFGSQYTKILTNSSDIDITILNVPTTLNTQSTHTEIDCLYTLATEIKNKHFVSYIEVISNAKVPIIKLDDKLTGLSVDICINNSSGLDTGKFILQGIKLYPQLRPLTIFLKVFLAQRGLNETYTGGLGSFVLTCMVLSFLQQRHHLHSKLHKLPISDTIDIDGNTSNPISGHKRSHNSSLSNPNVSNDEKASYMMCNLGVLLLDFFHVYGLTFNYYHTGISLLSNPHSHSHTTTITTTANKRQHMNTSTSSIHIKEDIKSNNNNNNNNNDNNDIEVVSLKYDYGYYYRKRERKGDWYNSNRPNLLSLENPLEPDQDIGRNSFQLNKIKRAFEHAYQVLTYVIHRCWCSTTTTTTTTTTNASNTDYNRNHSSFSYDRYNGSMFKNAKTNVAFTSQSFLSSNQSMLGYIIHNQDMIIHKAKSQQFIQSSNHAVSHIFSSSSTSSSIDSSNGDDSELTLYESDTILLMSMKEEEIQIYKSDATIPSTGTTTTISNNATETGSNDKSDKSDTNIEKGYSHSIDQLEVNTSKKQKVSNTTTTNSNSTLLTNTPTTTSVSATHKSLYNDNHGNSNNDINMHPIDSISIIQNMRMGKLTTNSNSNTTTSSTSTSSSSSSCILNKTAITVSTTATATNILSSASKTNPSIHSIDNSNHGEINKSSHSNNITNDKINKRKLDDFAPNLPTIINPSNTLNSNVKGNTDNTNNIHNNKNTIKKLIVVKINNTNNNIDSNSNNDDDSKNKDITTVTATTNIKKDKNTKKKKTKVNMQNNNMDNNYENTSSSSSIQEKQPKKKKQKQQKQNIINNTINMTLSTLSSSVSLINESSNTASESLIQVKPKRLGKRQQRKLRQLARMNNSNQNTIDISEKNGVSAIGGNTDITNNITNTTQNIVKASASSALHQDTTQSIGNKKPSKGRTVQFDGNTNTTDVQSTIGSNVTESSHRKRGNNSSNKRKQSNQEVIDLT